MARQYQTNRPDFYKTAAAYQWALPMMRVTKHGTGAMTAYVQSVAAPSYMLPVYISYDTSFGLDGEPSHCDGFGLYQNARMAWHNHIFMI